MPLMCRSIRIASLDRSILKFTAISPSIWAAALRVAFSKKVRRSPMQKAFAATCSRPFAISMSRCCAGRAAISLPTITGEMASGRATRVPGVWKWPGARLKITGLARIGAEPYICANLGTGTWDEVQQWVEYVNFDGDTATTRLRRQNGRDKPWGVRYWGLGNEMDGPWQMGHRTAEDYGKFALEAAKLMRWTDPSIKLVAAGASNYGPGADWIGWNRTVLQYLKQHVDYQSLHIYVGNPENYY